MAVSIAKLDNPVKHYAWGSREWLARLQGRAAPTAEPEAELWIGDHPAGPSRVIEPGNTLPLSDWIARDREAVLGPGRAELPFLAKLLAVDRPLSIQVHPDAARARAGWRREEDAGVPEARRCYRDAEAKHEVLVALEPFEALCGLRDDEAAARAREALPSLCRDGAPAASCRDLLARLLDPRRRRALLADLEVFGRGDSPDARRCAELLGEHPGDPLAAAPLVLERVELAPGEALVVPPGTLHAYLSGAGVEVMTRSDNVVRGGLTAKHVDADELLTILRPESVPTPQPARPCDTTPGLLAYDTGTNRFALRRLDITTDRALVSRPGGRVCILLCVAGRVAVEAASGSSADPVELGPGEAALVPARLAEFGLLARERTAQVFEVSCQ